MRICKYLNIITVQKKGHHNNNKLSINKKLNETQMKKKNPLTLVEYSCNCKGSSPSDLS